VLFFWPYVVLKEARRMQTVITLSPICLRLNLLICCMLLDPAWGFVAFGKIQFLGIA
jgi:hypothetical protein